MDVLLARLPALVAEHEAALARCRADARSETAADQATAARLAIFSALRQAGWLPPPRLCTAAALDRIVMGLDGEQAQPGQLGDDR